MADPQSVAGLRNFPFGSFDEFQEALKTGEVGLGIDRYVPFKIVSAGGRSTGGALFATIATWCWLWAVAPFFFVTWPVLGWWSLGMIAVGIVSAVFSRPWTAAWFVVVVGGATIYGFVASHPFLAWYGVAWLVVWFIRCGVHPHQRAAGRPRSGSQLAGPARLLVRVLPRAVAPGRRARCARKARAAEGLRADVGPPCTEPSAPVLWGHTTVSGSSCVRGARPSRLSARSARRNLSL